MALEKGSRPLSEFAGSSGGSRMQNNRNIWLLSVILAAAVVATYSNHFQNEFHFDDSHTMVNNVYIRNIRNLPLFFTDSTTSSSHPPNQTYRPIVVASTAVDYWLGGGLKPFYFHLSMFVVFLLQGILMYFLFLHIFNKAFQNEWNKLAALFGTALYLLHPANAETINYLLARSDSFSTFFVVLAFILFLYSSFCRRWWLYLIPVLLGGLTKPSAAMFAPLLLVYLLIFEEKVPLTSIFAQEFRARIKTLAVPATVLFVFCALMFAFIRSMDAPTWIPSLSPRYNYMITQPYVLLYYFGSFFLPIKLSADTDLSPFAGMLDIRFFAGVLFVSVLFFIAVAASKREKLYPVSFGILWFFIALIPTSTVFSLSEVMNDHRMFFPYVGLTMAVVWSSVLLLQKIAAEWPVPWFGRAVAVAAVFVLAGYAYGTHTRNAVWRTGETLWTDVVAKSPKNGRGWMNYGLTQMAKGNYPAAEAAFAKALETTPNYAQLYINIAILKNATGNPAEAELSFKKAMTLCESADAAPYAHYGAFLVGKKRWAEAIPLLKRSIALAPADIFTRYQLMAAYEQVGYLEELNDLVQEILSRDPNDAIAKAVLAAMADREANPGQPQYGGLVDQTPDGLLNISLRYYNEGNFKMCVKVAEAALKLRPGFAAAYNNICAAWNSQKEWDNAVAACERAVALDPSFQLAQNNLAWAISQRDIRP